MGKKKAEQLCFQGEKVRWISPADLKDLIRLKSEYPNALLLVGNTTIGWFQEEVHPSIHPSIYLSIYLSNYPSIHLILFSHRAEDESEGNRQSFGDLWWKHSRTSCYQMAKQ